MTKRNDDEFLQWLRDNDNDKNIKDSDTHNEELDSMKGATKSEEKNVFDNNFEEKESFEQKDNFEQEDSFEQEDNFEQEDTFEQDNIFEKEAAEEESTYFAGNSYNDDYINKIYVDKDYVDKQIAKSKSKFSAFKIVALILIGAILGSFIGPVVQSKLPGYANTSSSKQGNININPKEESNVENAVAKKAIPSVVGIHTSFIKSNPFMFGMEKKAEGIGSGVIVSEDGYILTNAHVIGENPERITVLFSDNTSMEAEVVYKNTNLDLAVIKVNKKGLPAIEFADSSKVQIGDKAIAIGNPLGFNLQSTLTSGYISGLDRSITLQGGTSMTNLIQTDASINSGNSGGALLNSKGQLIGINTAKAGSSDGIGFAIPSNTSKNIVDQIISKGSFTPVVLGINGIDLALYKQYTNNTSIQATKGVYIAEVVKNSSAAKAGLKSGDIIQEIDGVEINSMNKLQQTLITKRVGEKGKLKINRDNKELDLDIVYEGQPTNI